MAESGITSSMTPPVTSTSWVTEGAMEAETSPISRNVSPSDRNETGMSSIEGLPSASQNDSTMISSPPSSSSSSPSFPGSRYPPVDFDFLDTIQPSDLYLPDSDSSAEMMNSLTTSTPHIGNGTTALCLNMTSADVTGNSSVANVLCSSVPDNGVEVTRKFSETDLWAENEYFARSVIPAMLFVGCLMAVGILGNLLVVYIYGFRFKPATQHFLIVCLACFDLLMGAIAMPAEIADMRFHHVFDSAFACKLLRFITMFSSISSSFTLVTIAVDRHRRVTRPLTKQMAMRKARIWEMINLLLALFFSWPLLVLTGLRTSETRIPGLLGTDCSFSNEYRHSKYPLVYNAVLGTGFLTLITIIGVLYFRIWKTVKGHRVHMSKIPRGSQSGTSMYDIRKDEIIVGDLGREANLCRSEGDLLAKRTGRLMAEDSPQLSTRTADSPLTPRNIRAICGDVTPADAARNDVSSKEAKRFQLVLTNGTGKDAAVLFRKPKFSSLKLDSSSSRDFVNLTGELVKCSNCGMLQSKCSELFCSYQLKKRAASLKLPKQNSADINNQTFFPRHSPSPTTTTTNNSNNINNASVSSSPALSNKSLKNSPVLRARLQDPQNSVSLSIKSDDLRPMSSLLDSVSKSLAQGGVKYSDLMSCPEHQETVAGSSVGHFNSGEQRLYAEVEITSGGKNQTFDTDVNTSDRCGGTSGPDGESVSVSNCLSLHQPISKGESGDETCADCLQRSCDCLADNEIGEASGDSSKTGTRCIHNPQVNIDEKSCKSCLVHHQKTDNIPEATIRDNDSHRPSGNDSIRSMCVKPNTSCCSSDEIVAESLEKSSHENGIPLKKVLESSYPQSQLMAIPEQFREEFEDENCIVSDDSQKYKENRHEYRVDLSDSSDSQRTACDSPVLLNPTVNRRSTSPSVLENCRIKSGSLASLDNLTMTSSRPKGKGEARRVDKTTVVAFAVSSVFVLSFVPYLTLMFVRAFNKDFDYGLDGTALWVYNIFVRFYFLNSALNPILYGLLNERFRQECKRLLRCCSKQSKNGNVCV